MSSAPSCSIENGAEEVAEIEIEINLFADDNGNVKYEAINSDGFALADTWMTSWTPELVKQA